MTCRRTSLRFLIALVAAPVVLFAAALLFSASVSFAAPNAPAGLLRNPPSANDTFGSTLAATHGGIVHAIWHEPASQTHLRLRRIPCAAPGALSAGTSCFAAALAG